MKVPRVFVLVSCLASSGCAGNECYVGVRGTAASVTVKAMFPTDTCKSFAATPAKYLGDIALESGKDMYEMTDRPTQPVICEHTIDGRRFIVRDDGMLKVVGNLMCSGLAKRADR